MSDASFTRQTGCGYPRHRVPSNSLYETAVTCISCTNIFYIHHDHQSPCRWSVFLRVACVDSRVEIRAWGHASPRINRAERARRCNSEVLCFSPLKSVKRGIETDSVTHTHDGERRRFELREEGRNGDDLASVPVAKCNSNWWMHRCYVSLLYRAATRKRYRPLGHVTIPLQPDLPRASCSAPPSNGTTRTPTNTTCTLPSALPSVLPSFLRFLFPTLLPTVFVHLLHNAKKRRKIGMVQG